MQTKIEILDKKIHKSGFVSILGKPNAGKSTLLNALLEYKLSIATPKAQTTRHRILGISNGEDYQIVYSDTPGVIRPKYRLQEKMMGFVNHALEDADLILLMVAINEKFPEDILIGLANKTKIPIILVVNKVDLADDKRVNERIKALRAKVSFVESIAISALHNFNVEDLKKLILNYLPEGPAYYDKEALSDRPERFFMSEIIREKIFLLTKQEIPYGTEVEITSFQDKPKLIAIQATIHVERKSQKGMIIGKRGSMLKKIGTDARKDMEEFLGKKVFLELYVRVSDGWKDSNKHLRSFGYGD